MPDMLTRPAATADAFPPIEATTFEAEACAGRERRDIDERAVEQPVWQRRVVPRVMPQLRALVEVLVLGQMFDCCKAGSEAIGVVVPFDRRLAFHHADRLVGKSPGIHECERVRLPGRESHRLAHMSTRPTL